MKVSSTIGGLAGALALTLLNEGVRKLDKNAPRLDLLGQNALAKIVGGNHLLPQTARKIFPLAGDLLTNSIFYGMARGTSPGNTYMKGALLGLGAGIGAVTLPKQVGLDEDHTAKNPQRAIMTVAWYLIGGIVAAAVINAIDKSNEDPVSDIRHDVAAAGSKVKERIAETV